MLEKVFAEYEVGVMAKEYVLIHISVTFFKIGVLSTGCYFAESTFLIL